MSRGYTEAKYPALHSPCASTALVQAPLPGETVVFRIMSFFAYQTSPPLCYLVKPPFSVPLVLPVQGGGGANAMGESNNGPTKRSPHEFFDCEPTIPLKLDTKSFWGEGSKVCALKDLNQGRVK